MKVSELINLLGKCEPDADVEFSYASDATTSGTAIVSVVQITFLDKEESNTFHITQIRGA